MMLLGQTTQNDRRPVPGNEPSALASRLIASRGGFTLVEVMVALAILGMALTIISSSNQAGMRRTLRAKMMTVATMLAREKMIEIEDDLFEEGFSDFKDEESGHFKDDFKRFSYAYRVDKIELPASLPDDMLSGNEGDDGTDTQAPLSGMAAANSSLLGQQFELFRNVLEQAIRRVTLTVSWKEGKQKHAIEVTAFFTDPNKVDMGATTGTTTSDSTSSSSGSTSTSSKTGTAK